MNDLTELVEAGKLASFETVQGALQIVPMAWSIEKYRVAQMVALEGKTKKAIAKELGLPITAIDTWLRHPEFKEYIAQTVMDGVQALKSKKLQLLMKTLDAREAEAEIEGYATFSRKDSLDIITEIRKETGEERAVDSSYMNLLEKLVVNSTKQQPRTIVVEDV